MLKRRPGQPHKGWKKANRRLQRKPAAQRTINDYAKAAPSGSGASDAPLILQMNRFRA